jgi:hypothetical protein
MDEQRSAVSLAQTVSETAIHALYTAALSMFVYTFDMLLRVHIQMFGRQANNADILWFVLKLMITTDDLNHTCCVGLCTASLR